MTLRLEASVDTPAPVHAVWDTLVAWERQGEWIPLTRVTVLGKAAHGVGVRVVALTGWQIGRVPVGLLDRFVVTGWKAPAPAHAAELGVVHQGPYFTGPGVIRVEERARGSRIVATEVFDLPGGRLVERLVGVALPAMRLLFRRSLRRLGALAEARRP
jgi:hypothetical protein